jgi:hypothetical protein
MKKFGYFIHQFGPQIFYLFLQHEKIIYLIENLELNFLHKEYSEVDSECKRL